MTKNCRLRDSVLKKYKYLQDSDAKLENRLVILKTDLNKSNSSVQRMQEGKSKLDDILGAQ